jgi:hypothetical protein
MITALFFEFWPGIIYRLRRRFLWLTFVIIAVKVCKRGTIFAISEVWLVGVGREKLKKHLEFGCLICIGQGL